MSTFSRAMVFLSATCLGCSIATAADLRELPLQKDICVHGTVDKNKLAHHLLERRPILPAAFNDLPPPLAGEELFNVERRVLASPIIDRDCPDCSDGDKSNLHGIQSEMEGRILAGRERGLQPTNALVSAQAFFREPDGVDAVSCLVDSTGQAIDPVGSLVINTPPDNSHLRIRGKASDLYSDRTDQSFSSLSQATLDFASNKITHDRTTKASGVVGYDIELPLDRGQFAEFIPYAGVNWSTSRISKAAGGTVTDSKTVDFGMLASVFLIPADGSMGHLFSVRPDFLLNDANESKILSLNLQYMPIGNRVLNVLTPFDGGTAGYEFVANLRADGGFYSDRGSLPATNKDFLRLGGEAGFTLAGDEDAFPLTFTTSYIYLNDVEGGQDIGYLSSKLTYSFTKYWGVTLSYSNGRREDTADKERLWEVALTARY